MATNKDFSSDNAAPACPEIMAAVARVNAGSVPSYGADPCTAQLQQVVERIFEHEALVFPVATGTAANALALSQIAPPFGTIYCYEAAHIVTDECGAPQFFSGGASLSGLPAADGKIAPQDLESALARADELGAHHTKAAAVSLTQATEWGTVYRPSEIEAIHAIARRRDMPLHMDGARFANALVHLDCSPAEASWKCGINVLSLGATKNGALCAEAVVFFDPAQAADFDRRRKRSGHLWSKLRFLSAQLLAYFENDLWLANARHANAMAQRASQALALMEGIMLLHPVQANEIFLELPAKAVEALEAQHFKFYRWPLAAGRGITIRLVASYATTTEGVDALVDAVRRALS